jgi:hypothetical protein
MTIARFGTIVAAQINMLRLAGYHLARDFSGLEISDKERLANMRSGRDRLCSLTGTDFGFDLAAWRAFFRANKEFGYAEDYGCPGLSEGVDEAIRQEIGNPEYERLVQLLETDPGPRQRFGPDGRKVRDGRRADGTNRDSEEH